MHILLCCAFLFHPLMFSYPQLEALEEFEEFFVSQTGRSSPDIFLIILSLWWYAPITFTVSVVPLLTPTQNLTFLRLYFMCFKISKKLLSVIFILLRAASTSIPALACSPHLFFSNRVLDPRARRGKKINSW